MRIAAAAGALVVAAGLLAGCAGTVDGSGSPGSGAPTSGATAGGSADGSGASGSSAPSSGTDFPTPDFPSASLSPSGGSSDVTQTQTSCPRPYYAPASLRFTCITSGMTSSSDEVWPLLEIKQVESSGWSLEQGVARYSGKAASLETVAFAVRKLMVDEGAYLVSPDVVTLRIQSGTFGSRKAVIVTSQITLDPAAAAKRKTKVKQERLWILAVQTTPSVVSLWHVSLPDLVKSLWSKVPAAIATVQVST